MSKPRFEILDWVETELGPLCLRRRELLGRPGTVVTEVVLDHELLMSTLHTASEVALAELALDWRSADESAGLRVLVGGLGLGYTAHAAGQRAEVAQVTVVDALPEVLGWTRDGLLPLSSALADAERYQLELGDVYQRLLEPGSGAWDAILIDVDHTPGEPLGPSSAPFYTPPGLRTAASHLSSDGVLAVWSAGDDERFAQLMDEVFSESRRERVVWENELIGDGEEVEDVIFLGRRPR